MCATSCILLYVMSNVDYVLVSTCVIIEIRCVLIMDLSGMLLCEMTVSA
jgi:hypothetical protein